MTASHQLQEEPAALHPLDDLSIDETNAARDLVIGLHPNQVLYFREIYLEEPAKQELVSYIEAEHAGQRLTPPHRLAVVQFDTIGTDKIPHFCESIIDLSDRKRISHHVVDKQHQASLTVEEFRELCEDIQASKLYQEAIAVYELPEGFEVVLEPWPYGGLLPGEESRRYFQGLCFGKDTRSGNEDSNFYAFPIPIIPILDVQTRTVIRVEKLATGGKGEPLDHSDQKPRILDHCTAAEYVPELRPSSKREELKAINVIQPDGPSFSVEGRVVRWQGWSFRVSFNPREVGVLHDVRFQGRSVMYRLSLSEMTVPYGDARYPYARKQAMDFGDGFAGNAANNLSLGCDCLGVIKYFDGVTTDSKGNAKVAPNVICLHEQDNGIGWKHVNWRTGRSVTTRHRELVVQFAITLANYDYIFAFKLDLAGGITIESRATGIVSVVNIDPGKKQSDYGTVVGPGVLAQNHQHIFCIRMDPAIDGHNNTVVVEESHPVPVNQETNPYGNYYQIRKTPITKSTSIDACGSLNRVIKITNPSITNPISGNPIAYKFTPSSSQLLLAAPGTVQHSRASFAQHHVWVTKHKDGEFYAAGRYTLQSQREINGVADAAARDEPVENTDLVVWNVFGLTHNPRVEDWPVMPVEIHQVHIKPADFFTENPAIDVPSSRNETSVLAFTNGDSHSHCHGTNAATTNQVTNGQST